MQFPMVAVFVKSDSITTISKMMFKHLTLEICNEHVGWLID